MQSNGQSSLYEKGISFNEKHIKLCDQYPEGENLDKFFLDINPLEQYQQSKLMKRYFVIAQ